MNFSLFSRTASGADLLFFGTAARTLRSLLRRASSRSIRWRIGLTSTGTCAFVPGVKVGATLRLSGVNGPVEPSRGLRFDPTKVLLDPYGRGVVVPKGYSPAAAAPGTGDNTATAMKSVVVDSAAYDWEGRPRCSAAPTIGAHGHLRACTSRASPAIPTPVRVKEQIRGTYAGLAEKIPYLKDLGITAVELLPIHAFDVHACPAGRVNYWGYQSVSYFAPHPQYSSNRSPLGPVNEFRDMVKALHRAGIEVILDVVYNHTAEGNQNGPTLCYRGIDNPTYYILETDKQWYSDYSGCGNTLNANHPVVRRMIVDSLRYWVTEMHVDGFRFDLASILSRDANGHPLPNPPVLWDIESDPALAGTKLLAEAWDAAGLYQVGSFVGDAWKEWNGRFRDDARDFFRGEPGSVGKFADRMLGSYEVYGHKEREAEQSVNFVTCHDGFSLNDMVSYNGKHNEANGEDNRDGANDNKSWNCGAEGPTNDPAIEELRNRQVKNFHAVTMLSIGLPMILMGDEVRRTQGGNNNFYCHDNEANWFDWSLVEKHADVHRFVKLLLARRLLRDTTHEHARITLTEHIEQANKAWHGVKLNQPDWGEGSRSIAFGGQLKTEGLLFHLILNGSWEPLEFELPPPTAETGPWRRWIDTALPSPNDIVEWQLAVPVSGASYRAGPRSVVALIAGSGM